MKRLATLTLLLALGLFASLSAHTVNVGTVTNMVDSFPINTFFEYSYTQQLYTQPQINHQGEISKIRFYRGYIGSLDCGNDWTIYMGHTGRSEFTHNSAWEPVSNLTQVFSGSVLDNFPAPGNWMEITLDLPFYYDNVNNLIVAIHESTPYWDNTLAAEWGAFETNNFTGLVYYELFNEIDVNNPPAALGRSRHINAIQLVFPDTEVPLAPVLVFPENNASIVNGQDLCWTSAAGSADASGYDVYIDGVIVSNNQAATHYTVSNLATGTHTWQVVARNNIGTSAASEIRNFNFAEGIVIGTGTGAPVNMTPIYPAFRYSYSQSIYMQPEINIGNHRIESIAYYWNGAGAANYSRDWVIYMGHTQRTEFAGGDDWIPVNGLTQVFAGQVDLSATPGWILIELDTPFAYNNMDNLVVAVDENTPGSDDSNLFFYNTSSPGQNRSKIMYSNGYNIDPATVAVGNALDAYPNIMLQFGALPTNPIISVSPPSIDFGTVLNAQPSPPTTVMIANAGGGTLNLSQSDVSIIGTHAAEFSFQPLNLPAALGPGESVHLPVSVTGVSTGEISATLRIIYDGQNHDVALSANVLPPGMVVIGDGTQRQRHPFGLLYGHERSATLYTADQIGTTGFIDLISWHCVTPSNSIIPYRIWAKNTTETTLTPQSWQELITDMTLLKEGRYRPNNTGWHNFQLTTPFPYTGDGLIIAVESNYGGNGAGGSNSYRYTEVDADRHRFWKSDVEPPTGIGNVNGKMPNVMLHLNPDLEDIGTMSIVGNPSPTVGEQTNYTITLRNNGVNTQNDYQVKLVDEAGTELASIAGPSIEPQQTLQVSIAWTPPAVTQMNIYGKVAFVGDQYSFNDQTPALLLNVTPAALTPIIIGNGSETLSVPFDYSHECSLYQNLYFADEIGTAGNIYKLVLYNDFASNLSDMPVKIWMGVTDQQDLVASWIPANQLTLVFDGNVTFPMGQNEVIIPLQTPFSYMGGNLVVLFKRAMGTIYDNCSFKGQTATFTRARFAAFDGIDIDPNRTNHPGVTFSASYPKTTFMIAPFATGNIAGTVTGADNQALAAVSVLLSDGFHYTTTDTAGQYQLLNILPGDYTISFRKHGYHGHTQDFTLVEGDQVTIDATLQHMSQVNVSGTILDANTNSGIPDAQIQLSGYHPYQATTNAAGVFAIAEVFADQTYSYTITAAGYLDASGEVTIGSTDYNMGEIALNEMPYAPVSVLAVEGDAEDQVQLSWLAPDPGIQEVIESFEGETFPPAGWTQEVFNPGAVIIDHIIPFWHRASSAGYGFTPTDGSFHAGISGIAHPQDDWLITPLINCQPDSWLRFDTCVLQGATNGCHNYVKASTDGGASWNILWDAANQAGGWNLYETPIVINLGDYSGTQLKIAFHAYTDNYNILGSTWFIDNIYIGADYTNPPTKTSREPTGYKVYRLRSGQEQNEANWVCLNSQPIQELTLSDTDWESMPYGGYRWAVKTTYPSGLISMPVFSNSVNRGMFMGTITGTVKNEEGEPIFGAILTNTSGTYSTTTTTDSEGAYTLEVPTGPIALRVSAEGYQTVIKTNVIIHQNQVVTLHIVLHRETGADDPQTPVVATALNGNYPNPFNPQTTISYSVKEPGQVKLQIYNLKGQLVRTLIDTEHAAGHYKQIFDARDDRDRRLASGVYLIRMQAPGYHKTSKMMLMQ